MHKYFSTLCKNISQIITHSNKLSSQIPSGPKCRLLQEHQFLFWKITTWKHEELMRNFLEIFFLTKLLQSETFPASTCILLQHLWSLATFNYAKGLRIHFSWSTGRRPTSMVQILTSNIARGKNAKLAWSQELAPTKQRKRVDSKCEWNTKWSSIGL